MENMQKFVDRVIEDPSIKDASVQVKPDFVNRVLNVLDEEEKTATEVGNLTGIPSGVCRAILTSLEQVKGSPVVSEKLKYRIGQNTTPHDETPTASKKPQANNNGTQIISQIISILHERSQTIDSLADELGIESKTCELVVKKLISEGAIMIDDSIEWDEELYKLDSDGYEGYVERQKAGRVENKKPKLTGKVEKEESKASIKVKAPAKDKAEDKAEDKASDQELISVEDIVLNAIKDNGEMRLKAIVDVTPTGINKLDIEEAVEAMLKSKKIKAKNPKAKYPFYILSDEMKETESTKEDSGSLSREDDASSEKKVVGEPKTNNASDKKAVDKPKSKEIKKSATIQKSSLPKEKMLVGKDKKITDIAIEPSIRKNDSVESDFEFEYSDYSDIAAIQIALQDVMGTLKKSKQKQISAAIAQLEKEKVKVRAAVIKLSEAVEGMF